MTFTAIVTKVAKRTGVTTPDKIALIGEFVNQRYRSVASSCGLSMVQRTTATAVSASGSQYLTFGPTIPVEKILAVYDATTSPVTMLDEKSVDTIRTGLLVSGMATQFAIYTATANTVTIIVNSKSTTLYTLTADVLSNLTDLQGVQTPALPEDFHDILEVGAIADVLDDKEKSQQATKFEKKFDTRCGDLRYYLAKSAYMQIAQNLRRQSRASAPIVQ